MESEIMTVGIMAAGLTLLEIMRVAWLSKPSHRDFSPLFRFYLACWLLTWTEAAFLSSSEICSCAKSAVNLNSVQQNKLAPFSCILPSPHQTMPHIPTYEILL
jgi:hypothetical protein